MSAPRKSRTGRQNAPRPSDRLTLRDLPFAQLVRTHPDLIEARRRYAAKAPAKRRAAAEWEYHDAMAVGLFSKALGQVAHEDPSEPRLDAGVLALAIDPRFAPALLTVGSIEYQLGRVDAAMELFLGLAALPADEPDLAEVIDQAGDFLLDRNDFGNALELYETTVGQHAETASFWSGVGYCLGRLGRRTEAVAAARRALALEPSSAVRLNDPGLGAAGGGVVHRSSFRPGAGSGVGASRLRVATRQFGAARGAIETATRLAVEADMKDEAFITNMRNATGESSLRPVRNRCRSKRSGAPGFCHLRIEGFLPAVLLIMPLICGGNLRVIGQESQTVVATYRSETNILYRAETDLSDYARERCRLDLYYPTDRTDFATVVWFHGGGLTGGDRSIPGPLREKGIAVVAAGYRLSPHVKSPAYVEDAAAAVAWTFRNIGKYGGSTNRIFVSGHSAGGYLTSMVGLDRRWLAAHGMEANRIAGLAPLSPQAITHFTIRAERGLSDQQPVVDDLAPLYHVRKDAPPILLVTGDRERELLGRYEENAYFWRMLQVVGHPDAELIELKGYDHGQMAEPAYPLLLRFIEKHNPVSADSPVESAHWNQFRGPNGQGVAPGARIPVHFGPGSNVLWKLAIPSGHSSTVIWGDRLFLTAVDSDNPQELLTVAIDRQEGRILWRQQVQSERPGAFHSLNNAASSTPAADGRHVYAYFGTYGLICYDHAGNQVWERRLDTPRSKYGMATSPILYRDTVILAQDSDDGRSRLLALRADTGETEWEQLRPLFKAGWSTPMILRHGAAEDLIVLGSRRLTAYDPATGQERWWAGGFPEETVGVPVVGDGLLFASGAALGGRGDDHWDAVATWRTTIAEFDQNRDGQIQREEMTPGFAFIQRPELPRDNPGYGLPVNDMNVLLNIFDQDRNGIISETEWMQTMTGFAAISHPTLVALRPGASGDARPTHVAWELRRGIPETSSLLCSAGRLYLMRDGGLLTGLEAATGRELFRERLGAPGQYIASPIAVGDRLLVASVPGVVTVIQIADTLRVLASNEFGEGVYATPAAVGDRLYLRTLEHLYAFGL